MSFELHYASAQDNGYHGRDALRADGAVFAVADGVSSNQFSRLIAQGVVDSLSPSSSNCNLRAASKAAEQIVDDGATTLSAVAIRHGIFGNYWHFLSVGDSQTMLVRNNEIHYVNQKHTVVKNGREYITACFRSENGFRSTVPQHTPDIAKIAIRRGDLIALTTDGVANHFGEQGLLKRLTDISEYSPQTIASSLVEDSWVRDDKSAVVIAVS